MKSLFNLIHENWDVTQGESMAKARIRDNNAMYYQSNPLNSA